MSSGAISRCGRAFARVANMDAAGSFRERTQIGRLGRVSYRARGVSQRPLTVYSD